MSRSSTATQSLQVTSVANRRTLCVSDDLDLLLLVLFLFVARAMALFWYSDKLACGGVG